MITDIFSKRQKRLRGEFPDVYQYKNLPIEFRRQFVLIIKETIGEEGVDSYYGKNRGTFNFTNDYYQTTHDILCKEYGVFNLSDYAPTNREDIFQFFLSCDTYEHCLDIIELFCLLVSELRENHLHKKQSIKALLEINGRFKEHGIGYQFEIDANEIIRVDSQFIHAEVVKPVVQLLTSDTLYQGANDEFLSAHDHYRHNKYKECLNDCLKAFESFLKAIHEKRGWEYDKSKDTAQKLVQSCIDNGLIPSYLLSQYQSLGSLLKSGLPTTRNKESGHGQGTEIKEVPEHLASYALHLTATNLLFLSKCEENI